MQSSSPGGQEPRSWFSRLSLQQKVVSLVTLSIVWMLGLFVVLGTQSLTQTTERIMEERLVMARLAAGHIDQVLQQGVAQLEAIAQSEAINLEDQDLGPEKHLLQEVRRQLTIFTYGFSLIDRQGRMLLVEPHDAAAVGTFVGERPYIRQSLETNTCTVSSVMVAPGTQRPIASLACPVRDSRRQVTGVLEGAIDLIQPTIGGFVGPLALGQTGYAELVDENGIVLASTRPGRAFEASDHKEYFGSLVREQRTAVGTCHTCHGASRDPVQDILAFAPVTVAPWGVAIRQSEEEALAPSRNLQGKVILLGTGALVVALFLAWLTTEGVLRPIRVLTRAAERISAGDLATAIPARGGDEIDTLARTFDTMRQRLRASLEEIQGWNRELEARVVQRTVELERKYRELSALNTIATTVSEPLSLEVILHRSLDTVLELVGADVGGIMMWDEGLGGLVYRMHRGLSPEYLQGIAGLKPGEGIAGRAFESGRPVVVDNISEDPRLTRAVVRQEELRSFASIPLRAKDKVLGVLNLASRGERRFGPEDVSLFVAIGSQVGIAVENARLLDEAAKVQALRELDRLRSQLLSTVSHELRTPLSAIKGHATALLRRDIERDERTQRRYLRVIDQESDHLTGLIDDLLDMSRIEAGALRLDKHPLSVPDLAQQVVRQVRLQSRKHRFALEFPTDLPPVAADRRRLEQVLRNLLENAVKYSPQGGTIKVRGTNVDGVVITSVQDEGVGVRPQDLERVFEPFYRGDGPLGSSTHGTGLGLAICKGIVEAHGGRIWAESTLQVGSTFSFSLPALSDDAEGQNGLAAHWPAGASRGGQAAPSTSKESPG